mmetsp:Transcript_19902/g.28506  ORF Transcript_19902/g.28506 Transcript_19902/m.28506 type:complete len:230 (+) Transcript_19902:922-1611(+)
MLSTWRAREDLQRSLEHGLLVIPIPPQLVVHRHQLCQSVCDANVAHAQHFFPNLQRLCNQGLGFGELACSRVHEAQSGRGITECDLLLAAILIFNGLVVAQCVSLCCGVISSSQNHIQQLFKEGLGLAILHTHSWGHTQNGVAAEQTALRLTQLALLLQHKGINLQTLAHARICLVVDGLRQCVGLLGDFLGSVESVRVQQQQTPRTQRHGQHLDRRRVMWILSYCHFC